MGLSLISFLGKGKYQETNYSFEGVGTYQTHLLPIALCKLFKPNKLILIVTEKSKLAQSEKTGKPYIEEIEESIGDICEIKIQEIPSEVRENKLWEIFEKIADILSEEDELIIDITHSFRYLPLFITGVISYIRASKNIKINKIVYGAFEAKDQEKDITPIYDLTQFVEIQDWIVGTKFFLDTANAKLLSEMLSETQNKFWRKRENYYLSNLPKALGKISSLLNKFSCAIWLAQPLETMEVSTNLSKILKEAEPEIKLWAKPFYVIFSLLRQTAEMFAYPKPDELSKENLEIQRKILNFLLQKNLYMQAVTLAREWLISYVLFKKGNTEDWLNESLREKLAYEFNERNSKVDDLISEIQPIWNKIREIRNEVSHCGMRKKKTNTLRIINNLKKGIQLINELPL